MGKNVALLSSCAEDWWTAGEDEKEYEREDEIKGTEEERKIIENISFPLTVECS